MSSKETEAAKRQTLCSQGVIRAASPSFLGGQRPHQGWSVGWGGGLHSHVPLLRWHVWKSLSCQQRQLCEDQALKHPLFWGQQSVSQPSPALNPITLEKQRRPHSEGL